MTEMWTFTFFLTQIFFMPLCFQKKKLSLQKEKQTLNVKNYHSRKR